MRALSHRTISALGVVLVATTALHLLWPLLIAQGPSQVLRLGFGGFVAVAILWAALAGSAGRAVGRGVLGAALMCLLLVGTYSVWRWWAYDHATLFAPSGSDGAFVTRLGLPESEGGFQGDPILGVVVRYPLRFDPNHIAAQIELLLVALCVAGVAGRFAVVAKRPAAARAGMLIALLPLVCLVVRSLADGAEVEAVVSVLGGAWLIWALRTARTRGVAPPGATGASATEPAAAPS